MYRKIQSYIHSKPSERMYVPLADVKSGEGYSHVYSHAGREHRARKNKARPTVRRELRWFADLSSSLIRPVHKFTIYVPDNPVPIRTYVLVHISRRVLVTSVE